MKNLRAIPSRKPDNHYKKLKKISLGAAYLYKAVILPKMQGKEVYTGKVNMSAFDHEDIEIICDYYKYNVAAERPENKVLFELYSKISGAPPLNSHSDFI
ncbi:MAG TPA: hypothetical protein DDY61_00240 [Ruminococcaceae bacterium]|nr:hypothetical protein [Oscillospiraceae bacterium]HBJ10154.1 hypothetical protein [Oscillospiraceae bacterium]